MNRNEVLEFLELPESASDADLKSRLSDKLNYFQTLSENAPSEFLKKVYLQNIDKVKTIQRTLFQETVSASQPLHRPQVQNQQPANYQQPVSHHQQQYSQNPVAWLIRHTENQSAKTFPLFPGRNIVGRNPQPGVNTILLDDDAYVSRVHAVIDVVVTHGYDFYISDNPSANGGKASKNGTYLNGNDHRLVQKTKLKENDTIQLGMTKLILRHNNTSINKIVHEVEESDYMKTVVIDIF